jgi:hypothetical protein
MTCSHLMAFARLSLLVAVLLEAKTVRLIDPKAI